ncbi:MAG: S9 family peptidase [Gemmatimonadetes bacterium]|nr:S9 family peptidase [Gemmatimonadota bacterium]
MIKTVGTWIVALLLGVASWGISALAYRTPIPAPPRISTDGVGRVSWGPVVDNLDLTLRGTRAASFGGWLPGDRGMLIRASHLVVDRRLYTLPDAEADPVLVAGLPRNVSTVARAPDRDYMIVAWDEDGAEQFQLYRWDLRDANPVLLTDGNERSLFGAFDPTGDRFAFSSNRRNGTDFDVYVADPYREGSERLVFEGSGAWGAADWSPDGTTLLLKHVRASNDARLYLLDVATGDVRALAPSLDEPVGYGPVRYSRDGSHVYLVSDEGTEFRHLRALDLATDQESLITGHIPWDVEGFQEARDGSFLVVSINEDGRNRTWIHDVEEGRTEQLELFETGLTAVALHPTRPLLAVTHVDAGSGGAVYTYDLSNAELTLWAGDASDRSETAEPRLIRYPTFDEAEGAPRRISAFVYPGAGAGPRPVLIDIHGGPEAQARLTYGHIRRQRSGLTVIAPNVRGSTGYGRTFAKLDDGYLREDAVRDIGALLDWIEQQPDMDAGRIGVTGGSYGGYMSLASLVHFSDRIACGVDVVGVSNFVTFLENTAPYRRDLRRAEYGDERDPDMRRFLESISPLNNAHRIRSPLMVVQGANDPRVPVTESRQIVERVRNNGQTVGYIEAADEGHGIRKPWNALFTNTAQIEMMQDCLGGGGSADR